MSPDQMKEIVRRSFVEIVENGNFDPFEKACSPNYTQNGEASIQVLKEWIVEVRSAVPDLKIEIHEMIAEGDQVAWRCTGTGTHRGEYRGIAPTGKPINATGITITQFVDGKIAHDWAEGNWPGIAE